VSQTDEAAMGIKGTNVLAVSIRRRLTRILGLLPALKSIQKHCTLKKFSGQTIGVDAYGWLHRGVVGCAFALALDKPTSIHIDFVLSRVRMLIDFGVTPYLVFDGDNLPSKAGTNAARRKKRQESKALGMELHKAGKIAQAQQELQKAIDVTPLMARQLIEELKKLNVQYIVAPYEADAQLVYLEQKGIIDGILAEDSDMLVFGAKRLLTKLDKYGELVEIERADFAMCKDLNLAGWTDTMFRRMAILSGCDYLPNIGKLGLKTAHNLVRKHNDIGKILRIVQLEGKLIVPANYLEEFRNAELTFLHHRVFCPVAQRMVHLNDLTPDLSDTDMPYLGPYIEPDMALGVACGDLDPFSKRPLKLDRTFGRPALGDRRRQSYASAPELKPKKSLETFFNPSRQPLAELDPNSLTPSPSQQRLLERNRNASWEPRLISSAPVLRQNTTITAPPANFAERSSFLARASTLSAYQPPKRQRLCSESLDPSPATEGQQSPFFSAPQQDFSPLAQKGQKTRRGQRTKFEVFADENRAMLHASDAEVQQAASPPKAHLTESNDDPVRGQSDEEYSQESVPQSSPISNTPRRDDLGMGNRNTPSRCSLVKEVSQEEHPEEFVDLLEFHVQRQNAELNTARRSLLETFAFQQDKDRERALQSLGPPKQKHTYFAASEEVKRTALEKLPKRADIQSFCLELERPATWDRLSPKIQQSALESLGRQPVSAAARNKVPTTTTASFSGQQECTDVVGHTSTLGPARGSEDAIVPHSEDDSSEVGSPRPKLNLRAFAFGSV
jgi:exonuclease 1